MNEEKAISLFHSAWDNFPSRARLIRKDRTVLAVNKAAAREGLVPGARCIDGPGDHSRCLANAALRGKEGKVLFSEDGTVVFWAPLDGFEDLYIHGSLSRNRQ